MDYANYNEEKLTGGTVGMRKSAIINAGGYEKNGSRKGKLLPKITQRTNWTKVKSKKRKQKTQADQKLPVIEEETIMDDVIDTAIVEDKVAIVNTKTGEVEYFDAIVTDVD